MEIRGLILGAVLAAAAAAPAAAQVAPPVKPLPRAPRAAPAPAVPAARIYVIEQVGTEGPFPPDMAEKVKPMRVLREVQDYLEANRISYVWRRMELNSATVDPRLTAQIDRLPPKELFFVPQGGGGTFNVVVETR